MKNKMSEEESCIICYEEFATSLERGRVRTGCGHSYCAICFAQVMRVSNQCSMCRHEITPDVPPSTRIDINEISDDENITGDPEISVPYLEFYRRMALTRYPVETDFEQEIYGSASDIFNQTLLSMFSNFTRQG